MFSGPFLKREKSRLHGRATRANFLSHDLFLGKHQYGMLDCLAKAVEPLCIEQISPFVIIILDWIDWNFIEYIMKHVAYKLECFNRSIK